MYGHSHVRAHTAFAVIINSSYITAYEEALIRTKQIDKICVQTNEIQFLTKIISFL